MDSYMDSCKLCGVSIQSWEWLDLCRACRDSLNSARQVEFVFSICDVINQENEMYDFKKTIPEVSILSFDRSGGVVLLAIGHKIINELKKIGVEYIDLPKEKACIIEMDEKMWLIEDNSYYFVDEEYMPIPRVDKYELLFPMLLKLFMQVRLLGQKVENLENILLKEKK